MIEIIGPALNQWDTGRVVHITGIEAEYAHFANKGDSKAVILGIVDTHAKIPDFLLQTGKQLCVYAVKDGITVGTRTFYVQKRERPENYVYEDDQRNYIYELIQNAQTAADNATAVAQELREAKDSGEFKGDPGEPATDDQVAAAVEAYMEEHPVEVPDVDMTGVVKSVNGISPDENGNVEVAGGLTTDAKAALMAVVENIGLWTDGDGQTLIDNLRTALYNAPIASIYVVYAQSKTVYTSDSLDVLKDDLTVTATYTDGTSSVLTDYTLSGSLSVGTSTVTVSKDGKTARFEVTVTAARVAATGITLDNSALSFVSKAPVKLTATVKPENSTDSIVWASSEKAVATVSDDGTVTPVADGSCVITATAGDFTAECTVNVALPLNGLNIGNPYLTYDAATIPHTSGKTEEELLNKWYKADYTAWGTALGYSSSPMNRVFLHPFTDGTHYIRLVRKVATGAGTYFFAFANSDIGTNPTKTLGRLGSDYTGATATLISTFDSEYSDQYGRCDLGEWEYVDGSGSTYESAFVVCYKLVVPADVCVFMTMNSIATNDSPGISETFPNINKLYTIFESDPSANILQITE